MPHLAAYRSKEYQLSHDILTATEMKLCDFTNVSSQCGNVYNADYWGMQLQTALQPIFSVDHQRTIGYEALIRTTNQANEAIPPLTLLNHPESEFDSIYLDRLCRYVHVANFQRFSHAKNWLFINISAQASTQGRKYGKFFADLLNKFQLAPQNVVVEIIEDPTTNNQQLAQSVEYYKNMGCLVAIDDFGAGHSNFERVWKLKPDIVKLDRSLLTQAVKTKNKLNMLNSIVDLLHQAGCLVVIEGVEDKEQALIAMRSGADFLQGFYFAKPSTELTVEIDKKQLFVDLTNQFILSEQKKAREHTQYLTQYTHAFRETILLLQNDHFFNNACQSLFDLERSIRCFMLDGKGNQLGSTLVLNKRKSTLSSKFEQLHISENANWYRKHYVKKAVEQHNRVHISQPYRSITGDGLCITFSMAYRKSGITRILCYDIEPSEYD